MEKVKGFSFRAARTYFLSTMPNELLESETLESQGDTFADETEVLTVK